MLCSNLVAFRLAVGVLLELRTKHFKTNRAKCHAVSSAIVEDDTQPFLPTWDETTWDDLITVEGGEETEARWQTERRLVSF